MTRNAYLALLSGAAVAALSVGSASAADLIRPMPSPATSYAPASMPIANTGGDVWSGFYTGLHLGGVFADNDIDDQKIQGGVHAGYNQQFDMFVLGAELSANLNDDFHYTLAPGASLSQNWDVTASARAGVAFDQTMIYGKAGFTLAELAPNGGVTSGSDTHGGVSFGAGVEHQFGNGFGAQLEYIQTRFNGVESMVGGVGRSDDLVNHSVQVGLNYHF